MKRESSTGTRLCFGIFEKEVMSVLESLALADTEDTTHFTVSRLKIHERKDVDWLRTDDWGKGEGRSMLWIYDVALILRRVKKCTQLY